VLRDAAVGASGDFAPDRVCTGRIVRTSHPANVLTHAAYRELGGVEGALAKRAEAVFGSLAGDVQSSLPSVFRALVNVGESEAVARRQAPLAAAAPTREARAFVEAFVKTRLLVAASAADGSPVVSVAHEALLRQLAASTGLAGRGFASCC